ncbi:MAG: hypothetical protein LBD88_02710 [Candidatus Peribacteria bacterium]|nr:hypothetical protein [Candidatus Peribacteria bacterium]
MKPILNYNNTYEEFLKMNSSWADFSEYEDIIKENKRFIKFTKTSPQPSPFEEEGVDQFSPLKRGKQKESFFIE